MTDGGKIAEVRGQRSQSRGQRAFTGDLVIGFGTGSPVEGRGASPWVTQAASPGWNLWEQAPGLDWSGYPVASFRDSGWHVWLIGELYGQMTSSQPLNQFLSEIVRGTRPAAQLNGHALLLAWDEPQRQWNAWTDRFGTLHAYYARSGNSAAIGSSFPAVAQIASQRQLDWTALTGFFGFGFFPDDLTFHDDVRILRPATHYIFSERGEQLSARRYWEWHHEPDRNRSYEDTVAQFGELFVRVMSEMLDPAGLRTTDHGPWTSEVSSPASRIAIPISGGLDSRSTVAAVSRLWDYGTAGSRDQRSGVRGPGNGGNVVSGPLVPLSRHIWAYSYGYSDDSVETRIARQVAAVRGLPFKQFTIKPYLFGQIGQVLGAVEGFQDITQCRQAFIGDELRQHADYVIAAHWGDVWLDDMGLAPSGKKSEIRNAKSEIVLEHALGKMLKRGRAWLLENVCAPHLGKVQPEDLLRQFASEGMNSLQHIEDPDFRVKAFKTDNWSFRWTLASIRMFQAAAFPRLPFYDTRLADFFCTVPSEYLTGRRLQIDFLKESAPDLARVKWQPHDANLYDYENCNAWRLPKRSVQKIWRVLAGKKVVERNWEVQFGGEQGEASLNRWLLRPGLRLHQLVPKDKIQRLLHSFKLHPLQDGCGYTVSMLLTFSAWLERLIQRSEDANQISKRSGRLQEGLRACHEAVLGQ